MSVNVIRTNKSFEEWYNNINSKTNEISICVDYDEKIEWVFWFYKPVGGLCPPIHFLNIYPNDKMEIINKVMGEEIESRIYNLDGGTYECSTYIYAGKEIPDLSFLPEGFRIEMLIDKKKYIKPIIKGHCYCFSIFDFDYNNVYDGHIIDLSKCDINGEYCDFYEHTVLPPFNYYVVNNFKKRKIRL